MIPDDLKYTSDHEWLRLEGDAGTVGVTAFAQESLGDVTFVELPEVGARFGRGEVFGVVESVKAASDLFLPVAGEITAVNDALEASPEQVNSDPYGEGWIVRVKVDDPAEAADLMSPEAYREHIE